MQQKIEELTARVDKLEKIINSLSVPCARCKGLGYISHGIIGSPVPNCSVCHGSGFVPVKIMEDEDEK